MYGTKQLAGWPPTAAALSDHGPQQVHVVDLVADDSHRTPGHLTICPPQALRQRMDAAGAEGDRR
jgi:hypothetical protein